MKTQFTVIIERDVESGFLVGEIVELPGCYTQAPDMAQLEVNVREAISVYLKTLDKDEPMPEFVGALKLEVAV